ncbi:DNA-binding transcriptional regulator, AcrR family [Arthrobacter alpinus]|uniref:DNA-binding transcriptional regulator, AcrR family n=1 Tax=Arthrobacter alpinus TaxID=656366 RepID=A0A1H5LTX5_9MICC|nr:TetR/AcrR family transcriptional regulator [Arthrobacter alpinus]SEE80502.1 DNA-binding transcriptional regulator, AcrR family [Arthrobacter alpinus]
MPRVSDEHRQAMALRIEQAALECAHRKGLAVMSMADIIAESGLSAGAIYGYYKGKDEILAALATRLVGGRVAVLDRMAARVPVPHPAEALLEFMDTVSGPMRDGGLVVQIWGLSSHSESIGAIARDSYDQMVEHLAGYLATWYRETQGLDAEAGMRAATAILPAVLALMQGWLFKVPMAGTRDDAAYLAAVAALLRNL